MNLLLNGESLIRPLTGIGQYTRALIQHLGAPEIDCEVHCFRGNRVISGRAALAAMDRGDTRSSALADRVLGTLHTVASRVAFPYRVHRRAASEAFRLAGRKLPSGTVYHEPNYILKPFDGPRVVTVHDLSIVRYPEHHPRARVEYLGDNMHRSVHEASHVITDSELVRAEVIEHFGVRPDHVTAIHLGVDERFRPLPRDRIVPILDRQGLRPGKYLLSVGTLEPRKNLSRLLDAFERLPDGLRRQFPLAVVGARGWHSETLERRLEVMAGRGEVHRLGYVRRGDLPALYSGAALFLFPSLYEGFGLPVLEAMACGTAVITSEGTTMDEFAAGAVALVDPTDAAGIGDEIEYLLTEVRRRAALSDLGLARSRELSWRDCARRHLGIYRRVINE